MQHVLLALDKPSPGHRGSIVGEKSRHSAKQPRDKLKRVHVGSVDSAASCSEILGMRTSSSCGCSAMGYPCGGGAIWGAKVRYILPADGGLFCCNLVVLDSFFHGHMLLRSL